MSGYDQVAGSASNTDPELQPEAKVARTPPRVLGADEASTPSLRVEKDVEAKQAPLRREPKASAAPLPLDPEAETPEAPLRKDPEASKSRLNLRSKPPATVVKEVPAASPDEQRKPRVCLMGEFSAGKSTLSNLLIGCSALPVNITATQLPPVWIAKGGDAPYRVDLDDQEYDIDFNNLSDVSVNDTSHIRIFRDAKFLDICDLIDMPGISDPNMAATVWQRMIHHADIVLWCSHATQAWRQSEAAVWATMPPELYDKSLLLLTRMDRILSDRDRQRVIRRVTKETEGLFRDIVPVSLLQALEAGQDASKWQESGAAHLSDLLVDLIGEVASGETRRSVSRVRSRAAPGLEASLGEDASQPAKPSRVVMPTRVRPRPLTSRVATGPTSQL